MISFQKRKRSPRNVTQCSTSQTIKKHKIEKTFYFCFRYDWTFGLISLEFLTVWFGFSSSSHVMSLVDFRSPTAKDSTSSRHTKKNSSSLKHIFFFSSLSLPSSSSQWIWVRLTGQFSKTKAEWEGGMIPSTSLEICYYYLLEKKMIAIMKQRLATLPKNKCKLYGSMPEMLKILFLIRASRQVLSTEKCSKAPEPNFTQLFWTLY